MQLQDKKISELLDLEWLETNGQGSYASSSITGANTRKYHGLLVASSNPPTDRRVLVAKMEERMILNGVYYDLAVNQYPQTVYPQGHQYLKSFERRPIATWIYEHIRCGLKKKIFMVPNSNTTVVTYENIGNTTFEIEAHPLFENKDYHSTFRENGFDFYAERNESSMKIHAFYGSPAFYMHWSKGNFTEDRTWYRNVELPKEQYRGQDFIEDYYRIGFIKTELKPGEKLAVLFTTEKTMVGRKADVLERKLLKHIESVKDKTIKDKFYNDLLVSGNQFVVNRASTNSKSIIAGYHWFTDWGRDTMIAMRGLTIATGNQESSKSILSTFIKYLDQGMMPNRFPDYDGQEVEYNTIDATFWLFIALYEYCQKFNDFDFIKKHLKDLENIINWHIKGTRYNIHVTDEGFISGGEEGWQLTWMDARVDGYVVTPRIGCPVEINALWYNALCIFEYFSKLASKNVPSEISAIKKNCQKNFGKEFLTDEGYLYDVIVPGQFKDASFRPNQIYAVSLPFSPLTKKQNESIVRLVGEKLLTGFGLRTINKDNKEFIGHYGGNQWSRDTAYHQGTVWPFLFMEYWEAYLKVNKGSAKAKEEVVKALKILEDHFYNSACVHGISEIFDGDTPGEGRGCIQQAWSVAALIKLYTEHQLYNVENLNESEFKKSLEGVLN